AVVPVSEGGPQVQEYSFNFPITNRTFITATLCWTRFVNEAEANYHPQRPPAPDCPIDSNFGQVDYGDTYSPSNPPSVLYLNLYYGANLIAQSASPVDNLQHLHVPVAADGNPGDYRLEVAWVSGPGLHYSLAWWVGTPFLATNQLLDFGQAPDPPYPTYLTNNGARHIIVPGFYLGTGVDPESDGRPYGTDTDDDGVSFLTP